MPKVPMGEKRPCRRCKKSALTGQPDNDHVVALYTVCYNLVRIHKAARITPGMAARVTDRLWGMEDVVALLNDAAVGGGPSKPRQQPAKRRS